MQNEDINYSRIKNVSEKDTACLIKMDVFSLLAYPESQHCLAVANQLMVSNPISRLCIWTALAINLIWVLIEGLQKNSFVMKRANADS